MKYYDYSNGLRFVILEEPLRFQILHNRRKQPDDEVFGVGFDAIVKLKARLVELYPENNRGIPDGERWFIHLFQHLFMLSERVKRKYKKPKSRTR